MIVSKANLQTVHATKVDSNIPALDNVHIAEDGSTVAVGGKMMIVVSPVKQELKNKLVNVVQEKGYGSMSVNADTVRKIIRSIPADRKYSGLLEHCNVERIGSRTCCFTMTDGKREQSIVGKVYPREFLPYRTLVQNAVETSEVGKGMRLVMNLKRLLLLLQTIEKVAPDTSGDSPIWVEFTEKNYIIIRALNMITGQRCIGIMSPYGGTEGKWLNVDDWERSFTEEPVKIKHKKVLKHRKKIG